MKRSCDYIETIITIIKLVSILSRDCQTFSGRSDHIIHRPGTRNNVSGKKLELKSRRKLSNSRKF